MTDGPKEIRHRVMSAESIDIRQELADLCECVATLAAKLDQTRRTLGLDATPYSGPERPNEGHGAPRA